MSTAAPITRAGLCSVTFRASSPTEVIGYASDAGLASIEWGTDTHVPLGDRRLAADVGRQTRDAGLAVASLGSYFHCESREVAALLDTAQSLGASRVRVWAGVRGSDESSRAERHLVTANLRETALQASDRGIEVALEYHGGTLTDTLESTLALLDDVGLPNVSTYWQPRVDAGAAVACEELLSLGSWVSTVHVFSWWPGSTRLPLSRRTDLWGEALALANALRVTDALLEFVPGDDPAILRDEAAFLKSHLAADPAGHCNPHGQ